MIELAELGWDLLNAYWMIKKGIQIFHNIYRNLVFLSCTFNKRPFILSSTSVFFSPWLVVSTSASPLLKPASFVRAASPAPGKRWYHRFLSGFLAFQGDHIPINSFPFFVQYILGCMPLGLTENALMAIRSLNLSRLQFTEVFAFRRFQTGKFHWYPHAGIACTFFYHPAVMYLNRF